MINCFSVLNVKNRYPLSLTLFPKLFSLLVCDKHSHLSDIIPLKFKRKKVYYALNSLWKTFVVWGIRTVNIQMLEWFFSQKIDHESIYKSRMQFSD